MKLLCIDIGNSNIVASVCDDSGAVLVQQRAETRAEHTDASLYKWLRALCGEYTLCGSVLASVVPSLTALMCAAAAKLCGCEPLTVNWRTDSGITIKIDDPRETGADLIAGAAGAVQRYGAPCVVVDMGTATTFCAVSAQRELLGGAILPGLNTAFSALINSAAQLSDFDFSAPRSVIGKNTAECLNVGALPASAAMIDGMCERYEQLLGKSRFIVTGGLAHLVVPFCRLPVVLDEDILTYGLFTIYKRQNCTKGR